MLLAALPVLKPLSTTNLFHSSVSPRPGGPGMQARMRQALEMGLPEPEARGAPMGRLSPVSWVPLLPSLFYRSTWWF